MLCQAPAILPASMPLLFASEHGFSLPPRFSASLCRRRSFPNIAMRCLCRANRVRAAACRSNAHRFFSAAVHGVPTLCRRCSWRSSSLPAHINPMHIIASAARSCALLTLPPLRHAKLRFSMPPRCDAVAGQCNSMVCIPLPAPCLSRHCCPVSVLCLAVLANAVPPPQSARRQVKLPLPPLRHWPRPFHSP